MCLSTTVAVGALLTAGSAHAADGIWTGIVPGADWGVATNWSGSALPTGTATFADNSAATSVTVSPYATFGAMQIEAEAPAYSFTITSGGGMEFTAAGIVNDSSYAPVINLHAGAGLSFLNSSSAGNADVSNAGRTSFSDHATAGSARIANNDGSTYFHGMATAGSAAIVNNLGGTEFWDSSTAGRATITNNGGGTAFHESSTAGHAILTNISGTTFFLDTATAGSATIANHTGSMIVFTGAGTAGTAAITNDSGAGTLFWNSGTAGNAVITTNNGGYVHFYEAASGGAARFITNAGSIVNGIFDISGLATAGTTAGSIEGDGRYLLGAKTLTVGGNDLSTIVGGTIEDGGIGGGTGGSLAKVGTGTLTLAGANTYTGATTITAGTLRAGAADVFISSSSMIVERGGTLDLAGFNQTVASLNTAGRVSLGTGAGTNLTVTGDYVGSGGTMVFNTRLGDDNSPTDKLVVTGNTSGHTNVVVTNTGGLGAQTTGNGIEVVRVGGASNGQFVLANQGNRVAAGAFQYSLFQGGRDAPDGNWYLRSTGVRTEVPTYTATPALASRIGLAMLGSASERDGLGQHCLDTPDQTRRNDLRMPCHTTAWGRVFGQTGSAGRLGTDGMLDRRGPAYDFDLGGFEAGIDLVRTAHDTVGLYAGIGRLTSSVQGFTDGHAGKVQMDAYAVGSYWTHYGPGGWYTDAVLQGTWYQDVNASSVNLSGNQSLRTNGSSFTASFEGGYPILFGGGHALVPQAQLVYQRLSLAGGADQFGLVDFATTDELYGRLGARLTKDWVGFGGRAMTTWGEANVWHQFGDDATTTFRTLQGTHPTAVSTSFGGTWAQLRLGMSGQATRLVGVFATGDYNVAMSSQSGHSWGGRAGVRVSW